jgi:hypothetical protein
MDDGMHYLLGEHLSPVFARLCREAYGLDVVCVEELGRKGRSDEDQLAFAAAEGRCFVTRDHHDLIGLTYAFLSEGRPHTGVLGIPRSYADRDYVGIAAAIARYDVEHPEGMTPYMVDYLRPR